MLQILTLFLRKFLLCSTITTVKFTVCWKGTILRVYLKKSRRVFLQKNQLLKETISSKNRKRQMFCWPRCLELAKKSWKKKLKGRFVFCQRLIVRAPKSLPFGELLVWTDAGPVWSPSKWYPRLKPRKPKFINVQRSFLECSWLFWFM